MAEFSFELDLPPGINSDDTTFAAAGRWVDGNNVRFRGGKPEAIGNIVRILDSGAAAPTPRAMLAYTVGSASSPVIAVEPDASLWTSNGGVSGLIDIKPPGLVGGNRFGQIFRACILLEPVADGQAGVRLHDHGGR